MKQHPTAYEDQLPEKKHIREVYEHYNPLFAQILANVEKSLRNTISLSSNPTFKTRIKSFNSYYRKVLRVKKGTNLATDALICLTDMMGIRVICPFLEDLEIVIRQVQKNYDVKEVEYKGQANFKEFGYESVHVLIHIPPECIPSNLFDEGGNPYILPEDLVCEIQVRTILQDAWAEVEHELVYKSEFSPFDMPMRRKLASINANLSLADIIFQEIRDYQTKLQTEVEERRSTFYEQADLLIKHSPDVVGKIPEKINRVSPYVRGTIDDMLLDALHAHNDGDLEKAIKIYSIIINSDPEPAPTVLAVIHKHRGMAYFAENKYDEALEDFNKSLSYDPKNFRTVYYQGIVYSVKEENEKAYDSFTHSLELNEFQSHAHFRRALVLFKMGKYQEVLQDLSDAKKLGLDDDECKALRKKAATKFDMGM